MALSEPEPLHRTLSLTQLTSIRAAMHTFVADDLARGVSPAAPLYCDACDGPRPQPGFRAYERYQLCDPCATAYEAAMALGQVTTPGQFVRNARFGEAPFLHRDDEAACPGGERAGCAVV